MRLEQFRHIVIARASNVFDFAMSRNVSFRQNFERYKPAGMARNPVNILL